jgi:hypothetical protein
MARPQSRPPSKARASARCGTSFTATGAIEAGTTLTAGTSASVGTTLAIGTGATIGGTGAGTAAANLTLNKTAVGTSNVVYKEANAIRAKAGLDASENYVIEVFTGAAGAEASQGSITVAPTGAGGGADLDHINAMRLKIAFLLAPAPTIAFA